MQILPQTPGLGDLLGQGFQQGANTGSNLLMKALLDSQLQKQKSAQTDAYLQKLGLVGGNQESGTPSNVEDKERAILALSANPQTKDLANALMKLYEPELGAKKETKKREAEKSLLKQETIPILEKLENLKKYAGTTKIPGTSSFAGESLNRKAVQKRKQIDTLNAYLLKVLRDMDSKGQLPKGIFDELKSKIPTAKDSEREFQGKINAFKNFLGIEETPDETRTQAVMAPDGNVYDIPIDQVRQAVFAGGKVVK